MLRGPVGRLAVEQFGSWPYHVSADKAEGDCTVRGVAITSDADAATEERTRCKAAGQLVNARAWSEVQLKV